MTSRTFKRNSDKYGDIKDLLKNVKVTNKQTMQLLESHHAKVGMRSYSRSEGYFSTVGELEEGEERGYAEGTGRNKKQPKKIKKCPTLTGSKVEVASIMDLLAAFLKHS